MNNNQFIFSVTIQIITIGIIGYQIGGLLLSFVSMAGAFGIFLYIGD